jgi:hypothetical protein
LASWKPLKKKAGSGSVIQLYGSEDPDMDPDPQQNVMDPEHWRGLYVDYVVFVTSYFKEWQVCVGKILAFGPSISQLEQRVLV